MSVIKELFRAIFGRLPKVFTVVCILFCAGSNSYGGMSCQSLFPTTTKPEIQIHPRLLKPISTQFWELAYFTREVLIFNPNGGLDSDLSAAKLRKIVRETPVEILKLRTLEIVRAIDSKPWNKGLDRNTYTRLWIIYFAFDFNSAAKKFEQHLNSEDLTTQFLQPIGEFLRSYDPASARQLSLNLLRQFAYARKLRRWDTAGPIQQLAPKRAIAYLVKVLMNFPALLKSEVTPSGGIRFASFDRFLKSVADLVSEADAYAVLTTAEQIGTAVQILQQYLQKWTLKNPGQSASIVVDGSFANGFAIRNDSDIDILATNKVLRKDLSGSEIYKLQDLILSALKALGSTRTSLDINEGLFSFVGLDHVSDNKAREEGYLNTVSIEIFPDHVDILIHDPASSTTGSPTYETFRAE